MDATSLSTMAAAFFVVAVAPGPATLGCASIAMSQGRRAGLGFGFGLGLALLFWGVLAAIGLGAILAGSAEVMFGRVLPSLVGVESGSICSCRRD